MNKVILITGISSGFGKQTAELLSKKGHTVYGTIRKVSMATDLVNVLRMDLTDTYSIRKVVETVIQKEGRIDVLINNAGMHTGGPIETSPVENIKLQMDTNFMGMVHLTREVLPQMRKQGGGLIINFGSIGGLMGLPFQSFYSASKFAIKGFSEALRMEVRQFNIKVIEINPGDFHTSNSANRRNFLAPTGADDPYQKQFEKTLSVIEKDEANGRDPVILARKLVKIVECKNPRQRYIIASLEQKLAVILKYILPGKWFRMILEDHYKIN
ncbi:MAG: SDR family oxidoreductase [Bacteroidales bacterium]|nr:SDR family oxidoreductase [Bacteroidales bacterium]